MFLWRVAIRNHLAEAPPVNFVEGDRYSIAHAPDSHMPAPSGIPLDSFVSVNPLGLLYSDQGKYGDAEPLFKNALAIQEKLLGLEHPDIARSLLNLGIAYRQQKEFAKAEEAFNRAQAIATKSALVDRSVLNRIQDNLIQVYNQQGRYKDSLVIVRSRSSQKDGYRSSLEFESILGSRKTGMLIQEDSFVLSFELFQRLTQNATAAGAIESRAQRYAAGSDEVAMLLREWQDINIFERKKLDQALVASHSKPAAERDEVGEKEVERRIAEIDAESEKLLSAVKEKAPNYVANTERPSPLTLKETQKLLADDEAIIVFGLHVGGSYSWVVTKTESFWTEIAVPATTLNDQVTSLRRSLTFDVDRPFNAALAYQIYGELFGPISAPLAGKKHLSIISTGALTSLPLGILVTSDPSGKSAKDTDWLVKTAAISVLPSIRSLEVMRHQSPYSAAPKAMIAFADPLFSHRAHLEAHTAMRSLPSFYRASNLDVRSLGEALQQLPSTRDEVLAVGKSLHSDRGDIKFGADATVTAIKHSHLDQYRIIYFATHALVAGELEKFSKAKAEPALVLSIPDNPTADDDGLLQTSDVAQLKLDADWVVLSACNTAASDGAGAEALSGLASAFLYAGARSLVVSNWEVSDEATAVLMSRLFEISSKNPSLSRAEGLRQAMVTLLNESKNPEEAHPRMWAPFVVVGEPGTQLH